MMVESCYTSVMRSTRSGNYYNVPFSTVSPEMSTFANTDGSESESVAAAAWGTTTMRRVSAVMKRRDLNAALDSVAPSKNPHTFQPAFAFDLNKLVASLTKSSTSSSHNSSTRSLGEPVYEPTPEMSLGVVLPIDSESMQPRQRRRRGALFSEAELSCSHAPTSAAPPNSIIAYSLNRRKQKRLEAKALAAASVKCIDFEVAVADVGNEHQPQYMPRYVPEYQSSVKTLMSSRNREPSLDQQSYAL
ncbi:unnamed protein product [Peronospora destructor]|uniref:Uncharacterized protein n=1 Tax=Peronospora destructor TaxID=86335 RepID=A0AAV0UHL5_9STRA|nr:unnamed protein product [Peronospora destructor]